MSILFSSALFAFLARRHLRYLRYLQQENYDPKRFIKWFFATKAFDRMGSFFCLIALIPSMNFVAIAGLIALALFEENPTVSGKVLLKMTHRAKRIYVVALLLTLPLVFFPSPLLNILVIQLCPFILCLSLFLLSFDEERRQKHYRNEAKQLLQRINPFTIGITGSAGKTSTKEAVRTLLQITKGATFWPEKGVNTPMGIVREIRERLHPCHAYAVIEMGAYGKGSIKRLCDLTPPDAAIITEVGYCHLDRFGSTEMIQKTKEELAEALLPGSLLVLNGDNPLVREIGKRHPNSKKVHYGYLEENEVWIQSVKVFPKGSTFTFVYQGREYHGTTPLLGKTSIANLAAAFGLVVNLGVDPHFAVSALSSIACVDNRLQYVQDQGIGYLHDAYNSNPKGFFSAVEVLEHMEGRRKILMTPGMIELGAIQHEENCKIARKAAPFLAIAIIVNAENYNSLKQGFLEGGMNEKNVIYSSSRKEAFQLLKKTVTEGDLVLIENDLPDIYETKARW